MSVTSKGVAEREKTVSTTNRHPTDVLIGGEHFDKVLCGDKSEENSAKTSPLQLVRHDGQDCR